MASDLEKQWGGLDSNQRPADYEFDPALSRTREIEPREPLTSGFSPQRSPTLRNVSQSVAGPMRDTSRAGHAERRESELLCIRTNERVGPNRGLLTGTTARRSLMGPKGRTVRFQGRRIVIEASTRSSAESAEPGLAPRSSATAAGGSARGSLSSPTES
jgi:hypothetical protein